MATSNRAWIKTLFRLSGRLPLRVIATRGESPEPYLERYSVLRTRWLTIYLHRFVRRDQDHELHDHPWPALSLVLAGKYRERRLTEGMVTEEREVAWFNMIRSHQFHMIVDAEPETWTLLLHGPKRKSWGFLSGIVGDQASYREAPPSERTWHRSARPRPERQPLRDQA